MAKRKGKARKQRQVKTQAGTVTAVAQGVKAVVAPLASEQAKKAEKAFIDNAGKGKGKASAPVTKPEPVQAPALTTVTKDEEGEIQITSRTLSKQEKKRICKVHKAMEKTNEKKGFIRRVLKHFGTLLTGDARFVEEYEPVQTVTVLKKEHKKTIYRLTIRTMNHTQLQSGIWVTRASDMTFPCYSPDVYYKLMKYAKRIYSDERLRAQWRDQIKADIDLAATGKIVKRDMVLRGKVIYTYVIHDQLSERDSYADLLKESA